MLKTNYAYSWSDTDEDEDKDITEVMEEEAEVTDAVEYFVTEEDGPVSSSSSSTYRKRYMIYDIRTRAYNDALISINLSLMDEFGAKTYKTIYGDVYFNVYIEARSSSEKILAIMGASEIQCYDNTPEYITDKYSAMGYSEKPVFVWRLNILHNRLETIYSFCQSSNRKMFLNTELNDALPMVQNSLGIFIDVLEAGGGDGGGDNNVNNHPHIRYNSLLKSQHGQQQQRLFACRKLSIDIEVVTPPHWNLFPNAEERGCAIIIIACTRQTDETGSYVTELLYTDAQQRNVCAEGYVRFETERDMLEYFLRSITPYNTDLITGWNVRNFDLKYIYDRCVHFYGDLLPLFRLWTLNDSDIQFRNVTRKGQNVTLVECFGIMILDMYDYNKANIKAKSYKLKDIAARYLGEDKQKLSIDYKDITRFYETGNDEEMAHLLRYCSVDAEIVLDLMAVQKVWNNTVCMADICHVPMNYVVNSGVMLRNTCMISQYVHEHTNYLLPYRHTMPFIHYEGGYVNEPIVGFHSDPIFVLDFNSLYPTTMMAFNICTTTLVTDVRSVDPAYPAAADAYDPQELDQVLFADRTIAATPYLQNIGFVSSERRRGILPQILENLLRTRKEIQARLKQTKDGCEYKQLDAQQLSYKLCANAIYGLLGCSFSPLYNPHVAASVTSFGRFLSFIKRKRITEYMREDGLAGEIVYGDTDSVMVRIANRSIAETKEIAERYADRVTKDIGIPPIRTEYEKIFCPFIIHKKKHYIGVMYTNDCNKHAKVEYKGNEMVRSDNCNLTTNVMKRVIDILCFEPAGAAQLQVLDTSLRELLADWSSLYACYLAGDISNELRRKVVADGVYSKKLSKEKYANRLPHVAVYERCKNRKQYHVGDRVVFCIADTEFKSCSKKIVDMAYDIDEFLEAPDTLYLSVSYYIDACVRKPLNRLFATLDPEYKQTMERVLRDLFPVRANTAGRISRKRRRGKSLRPLPP